MNEIAAIRPEPATSLALALLASSKAPLLLLDDNFAVVGASQSFSQAFGIDPRTINGTELAKLGGGEWDVRQLHSLLKATFAGNAAIDAYEMDLRRKDHEPACLVLSAHKLDYDDAKPLVILTVTDVTSARLTAKIKDGLVQEKHLLLKELQHRVANSLQIIASVLLQSARNVQSEETRVHLHDAHRRVMSVATLQQQLALSSSDSVELRSYFQDLCGSIGASMIEDDTRITLIATGDSAKVSANVSVSLGLIVTELVINALKHAFVGTQPNGAIEVNYKAKGDAFNLSVSDDGVGMAAGAGQGKPGLGTGIVDALAKHLDATVEVSDNKPGTKVSVVRAA